jgi:hypothetical protein
VPKAPIILKPAWKKGKDALFIDHYTFLGVQYLGGRIPFERLRSQAKSYRKLPQQIPDKEERNRFLFSYLDRVQELKAQVGFAS